MPTYTFSIAGRRNGALGLAQNFTVPVEADDEAAARLKLYETHEHISHATLMFVEQAKAPDVETVVIDPKAVEPPDPPVAKPSMRPRM